MRHVEHMVRRIAALLLLAPELDASYVSAKAETYRWERAAKS